MPARPSVGDVRFHSRSSSIVAQPVWPRREWTFTFHPPRRDVGHRHRRTRWGGGDRIIWWTPLFRSPDASALFRGEKRYPDRSRFRVGGRHGSDPAGPESVAPIRWYPLVGGSPGQPREYDAGPSGKGQSRHSCTRPFLTVPRSRRFRVAHGSCSLDQKLDRRTDLRHP